MRSPIYIVDGYRTPFCKMGTNFADQSAVYLGVSVVKDLLTNVGINTEHIDEVIFGCVAQPADAMNIARVISVLSNIPHSIPAVSVHRNCASGFEAITYAYDRANSSGDVFVVGGTENMTRMPFLFPYSAVKKFSSLARSKSFINKIVELLKFRINDFSPQVGLKLGLSDVLCDMNMGQTAELIAREMNISRREQDEYAAQSHIKAKDNEHLIQEEISPVYLRNDDCINSFSGKCVTKDNGPRDDSTVQRLGRLRTVFDRQGTVTAGNSSQITDGAGALLLMTETGIDKTGCTPIGKIVDYAYAGCDPSRMGLGPVKAIEKLGEQSTRFKIENMDLVEINEAFAAQVLACQKQLKIPEEKLNVNGGAIALGHPVGASGTRLVLTLLKELKRRNLKSGLASLCVGGGQGGAIWMEVC